MKRFLIIIYLVVISISTAQLAYACEPAELDWDQLYLDYDQNKNHSIEKEEWKKLIQLKNQSYKWNDKADAKDPYRFKIFQQLDSNSNAQLSNEELYNIYQYFPNPCDGWGETWGVSGKQKTWSERLLDRLRALW